MSESSSKANYSSTWMLFESGNGVLVDLSLHFASQEKHRPIDAYVVTECEGGFTRSARRAAEAVYDTAKQNLPELKPLVVGYDLQGLHEQHHVSGESGGLAFAISLARRLFEQDPGPVAATGDIKSGGGGGPLGPVKNIEAKIEAASRIVPEGGWIIYPQDNDAEISDNLRKSLIDKRLRLKPVSSVDETISSLFDLKAPDDKIGGISTRKTWPLILAGLLIAVSIVFGITLWVNNNKQHEKEVPTQKEKTTQTGTSKPEENKFTVSPLKINLTVETAIADNLARLINDNLTLFLKERSTDLHYQPQISGRVMVSRIIEDTVIHRGDMRSEMAAELTGLTIKIDNKVKSYPIIKASAQGSGSALSLLPQIASNLTREITKLLALDINYTHKEIGSPTGSPIPEKYNKREDNIKGFE